MTLTEVVTFHSLRVTQRRLEEKTLIFRCRCEAETGASGPPVLAQPPVVSGKRGIRYTGLHTTNKTEAAGGKARVGEKMGKRGCGGGPSMGPEQREGCKDLARI